MGSVGVHDLLDVIDLRAGSHGVGVCDGSISRGGILSFDSLVSLLRVGADLEGGGSIVKKELVNIVVVLGVLSVFISVLASLVESIGVGFVDVSVVEVIHSVFTDSAGGLESVGIAEDGQVKLAEGGLKTSLVCGDGASIGIDRGVDVGVLFFELLEDRGSVVLLSVKTGRLEVALDRSKAKDSKGKGKNDSQHYYYIGYLFSNQSIPEGVLGFWGYRH